MPLRTAASLLLFSGLLVAQVTRPKDVREIAKGGSNAIPQLQALLKNPDSDIRYEAVKSLVEIGTQRSIDPLIEATRDADPKLQMMATDGMVNFYLPGYVKTGVAGTFDRMGRGIKSRFTDTNDQVIDPYVQPRPEVIVALGKLASGGSSMESRANASRAAGILRGREAIPDLIEALKTKD